MFKRLAGSAQQALTCLVHEPAMHIPHCVEVSPLKWQVVASAPGSSWTRRMHPAHVIASTNGARTAWGGPFDRTSIRLISPTKFYRRGGGRAGGADPDVPPGKLGKPPLQ